jgi:hypothetical protein
MTLNSLRNSENGKSKPGVYKVQNLNSETHLDVLRHSKEVCRRPTKGFEDGGGGARTSVSESTISGSRIRRLKMGDQRVWVWVYDAEGEVTDAIQLEQHEN